MLRILSSFLSRRKTLVRIESKDVHGPCGVGDKTKCFNFQIEVAGIESRLSKPVLRLLLGSVLDGRN